MLIEKFFEVEKSICCSKLKFFFLFLVALLSLQFQDKKLCSIEFSKKIMLFLKYKNFKHRKPQKSMIEVKWKVYRNEFLLFFTLKLFIFCKLCIYRLQNYRLMRSFLSLLHVLLFLPLIIFSIDPFYNSRSKRRIFFYIFKELLLVSIIRFERYWSFSKLSQDFGSTLLVINETHKIFSILLSVWWPCAVNYFPVNNLMLKREFYKALINNGKTSLMLNAFS